MRLSYVIGLFCLLPVCVWLLIHLKTDAEYIRLLTNIQVSQLTLFLVQMCMLCLFLPWLNKNTSELESVIGEKIQHYFRFVIGVLICSVPFSIFVWLSRGMSFEEIATLYLILAISSIVLFVFSIVLEAIQVNDYFKQIIRISVQLFLIVHLIIHRDSIFLWIV